MTQLLQRSEEALAELQSTYRRPLHDRIDWNDPLIFLLGPRGVGKTTLLLQRLKQLELPAKEALYVDMGDLYFRGNRLLETAENYLAQGGKYLFIDEVHRYGFPTWASELKQIYDLYRSRLKVIVTGSSVIKILNSQADLSRRVLSYRLPGLSFREYANLSGGTDIPIFNLEDILARHGDIARQIIQDFLPDPLDQLATYWRTGYYPYFITGNTGYAGRLSRSVQTVLEQDIAYATDAPNADALKLGRLLYAIASSVPFVPNMVKLAERTGISRPTLLIYLSLLERAGLINSLRAESRGIAAVGKPDKIYFDNPNLLYALAPQQTQIGTVRETFFYNQLKYLTYEQHVFPPEVRLPKHGDFAFHDKFNRTVFEIGGPNKTKKQIQTEENSYVVTDTLSTAVPDRIPLWLFGLLY